MSQRFGAKPEVDAFGIPFSNEVAGFFETIPLEVRVVIPLLNSVGVEVVQTVTNWVLKSLKFGNFKDSGYNEVTKDLNISVEDCHKIVTGIYLILSTFIRKRVKVSIARETLTKLTIKPAVVDVLCFPLSSTIRRPLEMSCQQNSPSQGKLAHVKWRIDVIISSSSLIRVMRPSLLMQVFLFDGSNTWCSLLMSYVM
jgi:hypothetical protein